MLSLRKRWQNAHFFWKLVLNFFVVVTVVLLVQVALFSRLYGQMETELRGNGEQILAHSVEMVDEEIKNVQRIAAQLSVDRQLRDFATETQELESVPPILLYRLTRYLPNVIDTQQAISEAIVHFTAPDVFVKFGVGSTRSTLFYDSYDGAPRKLGMAGLTYDQWRAAIYEGSRRPGFRDTDSGILRSIEDHVIYVHLLYRIGSLGEPFGAVLIYIDTSAILGQIDDFLVAGDAGLTITDPGGNLIASDQATDEMRRIAAMEAASERPDTLRVGTDDLAVMRQVSAQTGWVYHAFVPTGVLLQQAHQMRTISLFVVGSVLLLMAAIVSLMASRISRPIREIASMVAGRASDGSQTDEIAQIRGGLSNLIDRNTGLQLELERDTELLRSSFLGQLLLNGFRTPEALAAYVESAGLDLGEGGYRVVVAVVSAADADGELNDPSASQGARVLATRAIRQILGDGVHTQNIATDQIATLLVGQHPFDRSTLTQQLNGIATLLATRYDVRAYFACGEIIPDLLGASRQFRQVADHLSLAGSERTSMVFVDEVTTPDTIWHYPIETEMQLLTQLKMGDLSGSMAILERVLGENKLPEGADYAELYRALAGTFLRCANEMLTSGQYSEIRSRVPDVQRSFDGVTFLTRANSIVDHLCGLIRSRHESTNTQLRSRITEYLYQHFADPMLNLYAVAKVFDLNEKYLSRFFHDQTGQTFSGYLERLRMDRAARLLRTTDATVDTVAGTVGYTSTNTFHKAFRRIYSTTPGRFRQEIRNEDAADVG